MLNKNKNKQNKQNSKLEEIIEQGNAELQRNFVEEEVN